MVSQNNESIVKEILKNLCCNNGWSYGVFWSYNQQNPLLLTLQDEYHEDQTGFLIDDMLLQVHMFGEGVIGRAASTMKHQFFFSDAQINNQNSGFEVYQDNFEISSQLLASIKTISIIPVEQLGVVQFGSFQKLSETMEFVEQTRALLSEMENGGLITREYKSLSSSSEILIPSGVFASLLSTSDNPMETMLPLTNLIWPSTSPSFDERIEAMDNQLNFDGCVPNILSQQPFRPSASYVNNAIDIAPCSSLWKSEVSAQTSTISEGGGFHLANNSQDNKNDLFCTDDLFNNMESDLWLSSTDPSTSIESSLSNVFTTVGNNKRSTMSGIGNLLGHSGEDSGCSRSEQFGNSISSGHMENSGIGSKGILRPTNNLFSSLGINKLLDDISSIEDQFSSANKRRRTDTPLPRSNEERLSTWASSGGEMNIFHSIYNPNTMSNAAPERDAIHRPLSDSSICDSFHGGRDSQHKQAEQPAKNPKKKSRPGVRPRPKDRQQIADRLLELRKIIPNAEKMSIDSLLHRTIKHLFFLQSVSEHAESIKQLTDPKKDRIVPRDITSSRDSGVTWACEVDDQMLVYPLIVEDLNTPGQMSIEIQCEEHDSFLEIVDIIRGFGLTILKGVMEAEKAKMYARFKVATKGKNHVTRHEIFSSLLQLLQFTSSSDVGPSDQWL